MDRNRVRGAVRNTVGKASEAAGKAMGDEKLKRRGQTERVKGKVQNTVGGVKDALRDRDRGRTAGR